MRLPQASAGSGGLKLPSSHGKRQRTTSAVSPVNVENSSVKNSLKPGFSDATKNMRKSPRLIAMESPIAKQRLALGKSPAKSRMLKKVGKIPAPQSHMSQPSKLAAPSTTVTSNLPTSKPSLLKGPMKKLELVKPNLQRKMIAPTQSKLAKPGAVAAGPLKSAGPMKAPVSRQSTQQSSIQPLKALGNLPQPNIPDETPVKKDKIIAPKKLLESAQLVTPKKNSQ